MKIFVLVVMSLLAVAGGSAFADEYKQQVKRLQTFMSYEQMGNGSDYWLVKDTPWGWEKVALVFGYHDDWSGCQDIVAKMNDAYGREVYRCKPAN